MIYGSGLVHNRLDYLDEQERRSLSTQELELALQVSLLVDTLLISPEKRSFYFCRVINYNSRGNKLEIEKADGKREVLYLRRFRPDIKPNKIILVDRSNGSIATFGGYSENHV